MRGRARGQAKSGWCCGSACVHPPASQGGHSLAWVEVDGRSCRELLEGRAHSKSLGYAPNDTGAADPGECRAYSARIIFEIVSQPFWAGLTVWRTALRASHPWRFCGVISFSTCPGKLAARDDKVGGHGPPRHEWTWMDRIEKKLIWTRLAESSPGRRPGLGTSVDLNPKRP